MIVEIPVYMENIIKQQAEQQGITAEQLVQQSLASQFAVSQTKVERPFNFDMEAMDKAIHSGFTPPIPDHALKDVASLEQWFQGV